MWSLTVLAAGLLLVVVTRKPSADMAISAEHAGSASKASAAPASAPEPGSTSRSAGQKIRASRSAPVAGSAPPRSTISKTETMRSGLWRAGLGFWRWAREIDAPGTAPALIPVPRPDATRANRLAQHVKGGQLVDWGATIEFDFRPACYDASQYVGVSFSSARSRAHLLCTARAVWHPDRRRRQL